MLDGLRDLPARILAKLPEDQRNDPQVQQQVGRLALSALTSSGLAMLAGDVDHPMFVPQNSPIFTIGQPNSDTLYRMASLAPDGVYRLRGRRGTLPIAVIAELGPMPGDVAPSSGAVGPAKEVHDLNALHVDAQGRFDVIMSAERPAGYAGDWWRLEPTTAKLMLRMVSSDWANEEDPTISIERLDRPVNRRRPSAAELQDHLRRLPAAANFIGPLLADDVEKVRQEGFINRLEVHDPSQRGGLAGQFYYKGAYDLRDDEALVIEAKVPNKCAYYSTILTNRTYETTDWLNNQSSLNNAQSRVDRDGVLRIVISAKDPGVPNWLDTAGYPQGLVQGRWTNCDSQPVPTARKIAVTDVRKYVPSDTPGVTPAERERSIRDRRAAYLQRPIW